MASSSRAVKQTAVYVVIAFFCTMAVIFLLLWYLQPEKIAAMYAILRQIQTFGQWRYLPGGEAFLNTPLGFQPLEWVFTTSVPFGILNFVLIVCMGFFAFDKVSRDHIRRYVKTDDYLRFQEVMERMAHRFPANRFFLDHDLTSFPVDRGVARMPATALEFLEAHDAITGVAIDNKDGAPPSFVVDRSKVKTALRAAFGPRNPFAARDMQALTERGEIAACINELQWHHLLIAYPAIRRLHALHTETDKEFPRVQKEMDEFFKRVWKEINALKASLGPGLVLGFADDDDESLKRSSYREMRKSLKPKRRKRLPEELVTLQVALGEHADRFETVIEARQQLLTILTDHLRVADPGETKKKLPAGVDEDGKLVRKVEGSLSASEQDFYRTHVKKQSAAVADFETALLANGFVGGMLAALLKSTRKVGVLQPALFRWLRFYDRPLWMTLHNHGQNAPFVENAGVYEHIQAEDLLGQVLSDPFVDKSADAIVEEANTYLTQDVMKNYEVIQTFTKAQKKTHAGLTTLLEGQVVGGTAILETDDIDTPHRSEANAAPVAADPKVRRPAFSRKAVT